MSLNVVGPKDPRKYNMERDMLWALHRYFRRALEEIGDDGSDGALREVLLKHGITPPTRTNLMFSLKQLVKRLADIIAVPTSPDRSGDVPDAGKKAEQLLLDLFSDIDPGIRALRTLFGVAFLKGVLCEYPFWCEQARPKHMHDPVPNVDRVEEYANAFLDRLSADGGTSSD